MKNYDLITPEGTKDLLFGECIVRRDIENTLMGLFRSRGYSETITPGLEFYDVFNLNSRYFPQENLYKLTDSKGRLLVMRPDNTMPIARIVATRLRDADLPLKLCYVQPVYTTEPSLKGRSDEVVQTGIELIGSQLKMADLEVISTAVDSLGSFGMEFSLELGHIGIFKELVGKLEASDKDKESIRKLIENLSVEDCLVRDSTFRALHSFCQLVFGCVIVGNDLAQSIKPAPGDIARVCCRTVKYNYLHLSFLRRFFH